MSNAILMSGGADDIDFMIHGLFSYQLFGHTVWITTSHVCILIVMLVILIFAVIANRKIKHATEVPDGFQNVIELIVEKLDGVVMGTMGKVAGPKFVNYISTIFIFIFMSNISGLFGLRPPTADYGTTLALGLITFFLIHITQFKNLPLKQIWVDMCSPLPPWSPIWFPINVISEIAVPISVITFVRKRIIRNRYDGACIRLIEQNCDYLAGILFMCTLICSQEQFRPMYSVC